MIEFSGKLSEADLEDVGRLTRPSFYYLRIVLANWYGTILFVAVAWATVAALVDRANSNWGALAIIWVIIVAIIVWSVHRVKRDTAKERGRLNAALPDQIAFTNEGIALDGPSGAKAFLPWNHFSGWRESPRVILVDQSQINSAVMVSVAHLSETERVPIRQFLQAHVPAEGR